MIKTIDTHIPHELPVLSLRDIVIFPYMVMPLHVGRPKSVSAINLAIRTHQKILAVSQKVSSVEDPKEENLFSVGTMCTVLQILKLPDGNMKVLVEGERRAKIKKFHFEHNIILADINVPEDQNKEIVQSPEIEALAKTAISFFQQYVRLNQKIPSEILSLLSGIEDYNRLTDTISAYLNLKVQDRQELLEAFDIRIRLNLLIKQLEVAIDFLHMDKRVGSRVKKQIEKNQREYYLTEQMKAIQKELGVEEVMNDVEELEKKITLSGMTQEASEKAMAELKKLKMMPPMSAESSVTRNYLDWIANVPWKETTVISRNLKEAEKVLNEHHYGLEEVKDRILEYLAVQNRVQKLKGPILCFVGPPGTGKTSLAQSIAEATNRKFIRMSLGGLRDEAEIRGHRRTYIGSMPGKILQNMKKGGVCNPLFLLDEVDKMSMDFRGDPASALLEVLDPEQNSKFNDLYLEVDYDLSNVLFVTTANTLDIPDPLLDRMEVIELSGYTEDEKTNIAKTHLLKKLYEENGLNPGELSITDDAIIEIIRYYTGEAGVRNLEREISKICRKIVKKHLLKKNGKNKEVVIKPEDIEEYLGVRKYRFGKAENDNRVGEVTGLAWTRAGGDLLTIEAAIMHGKGNAIITGQLGEVMQESVQAALTVIRSRALQLGIDPKIFDRKDLHIHVPEGAIPKDGPSAGVAMCIALVSALTNIPVRANIAMTGEITLRGEVLPIGGLKEKLLAARRGCIGIVLIPEENVKDLKEIPDQIKKNLDIRPIRWIDQVFEMALETQPKPLQEDSAMPKKASAGKNFENRFHPELQEE